MVMTKSFSQQRIEDLAAWASQVSHPGIKQDTYNCIFDYVLRKQDVRGFWTVTGTQWDVVMTGVVLKALDGLQFSTHDSWATDGGEGGILPAVTFLKSVLENANYNPERVREDLWDACQAALALKRFDDSDNTLQMVRRINNDWKKLYDDACKSSDKIKWCSPAYLAAMIDVMGAYHDGLAKDSQLYQALECLKTLEEKEQGTNTACFRAINSREDIDLWC